jgi:GntR family transcriptional regulator
MSVNDGRPSSLPIHERVLQVRLEANSEVPIYVQVKNQIRLAVERGELPPGTQLPTVRDLAVELNINANTVARIYADLEREGYLVRRRGIGTFAVERSTENEARANAPPGRAQLEETLRQLRQLGYGKRQILEMAAELLHEERA